MNQQFIHMNTKPSVVTITAEHQKAGLEWMMEISKPENWDLKKGETAKLLGISTQKYVALIAKKNIQLERDILERISLLLGIYKSLDSIAPNKAEALRFFNRKGLGEISNDLSIKNYLLENNGMTSLYKVRAHLESISPVMDSYL